MEAVDVGAGGAGQLVAVVPLSGELDAADPTWADDIAAALDAGTDRLVVDLLNVTFIDSSVVRALVLAHRRVGGDGWLRLVWTHHLISRVIQICGLADTFPQFTTVDAALRAAPTRVASHRSAASGEEMQRAENVRYLDMTGDPLRSSRGSDHDER